MARSARQSATNALVVTAVAIALIVSVAAVWFSSEVIPTPRNDEVAAPPLVDRVVLVVIDGMRYDTALESDLMPRLQAIGRRGAEGMSLASNVTMTGLGVRTLGTSTSPALADILLEAKLPPVAFDNIFASLRRRGGHVAWLGNTSWKDLFGEWIDVDAHIDAELDLMSRVNNVWAADRVIVRRAVGLMSRDTWQLCIVHLGGLDNASHRFTPFGEPFRDKARAVDADIARIVAAAGEHTTVIITSDHGTSDRGHHGSGEPITRRTPIVLTGAAVAPGHTLDAHQTDVAPTIAALLGLPIPAPAEGQILFAGLDMPPATEAALRAANVAQQQRYARAYATARGLEPPEIDGTPAGLRRLGEWIEDTRARNGIVPALWALALMLAALALLGDGGGRLGLPAAGVTVACAAWSVAFGGRSEPAAVTALLAAAVGAADALAAVPRRRAAIAAGVAVIAAIEIGLAGWKLNHRFLEMKMHDVYDAVHASDTVFATVVALVAAALGAFAARRWWVATRWATIGVLVGASALADSITIPAAIAVGAAAGAAFASGRARIAIAVTAAAGIVAVATVEIVAHAGLPFDLAAPVVLAGLGVWFGPRRVRSRIALVAMAAAAVAVDLAGDPAIAYRATLAAIALVAVALAWLDRDDHPVATIGWAAAIMLGMLSQPAQLPGLVVWCGFAALVGRSAVVSASDERAVLVATLTAVAFRFACFGLFEGAFELSHLEVWLAYQGNPGTQVAFGAAIIAIKLALPLAIGLALVTAQMTAAARRAATSWTIAFLCLRIAHIAIGMTVARGTFYSPYLDSGQLAFTYLMLASAPIVIALFAAAGAWRTRPLR